MEISAPSGWRCIDIISDLHLQVDAPQTALAWRNYLMGTTADAVFILGDVFEVWVGDDILDQSDGFESQCVQILKNAARDRDIFIMPGNRDFLMGTRLMQSCNCTLLEDPTVLVLGGERWLLTHGDALCLDDADYMKFRSMVRSTAWSEEFLRQPLSERVAQATQMRAQSETKKRSDFVYADVDTSAAKALLERHHAKHMLHGHTHHPGVHSLTRHSNRYVLSDWDFCANPPRGEVFRLSLQSQPDLPAVQVQRIGVDIPTPS
jgi:UDP-2,3-diacylglucosamine hydrolase